jgi:hypothetical protein
MSEGLGLVNAQSSGIVVPGRLSCWRSFPSERVGAGKGLNRRSAAQSGRIVALTLKLEAAKG